MCRIGWLVPSETQIISGTMQFGWRLVWGHTRDRGMSQGGDNPKLTLSVDVVIVVPIWPSSHGARRWALDGLL